MSARLYVIPGSHPSMAARMMLESKGVEYKRRDLISPLHRTFLRIAGFQGITVPALKVDGKRIQGTGAIARWLDETRPGPPLVPEDPELRARVEEAEHWGDQDLQPAVRRVTWWAVLQDRSGAASFLEGARLGLPTPVLARTSGPFIKAAARANGVTDERARADLAGFPAAFDRVDGYIADGTIGGEALNVADFQIATSIRLLMAFEDLRPALESRPAGRHALRVEPDCPGRNAPLMDAEARAAALGEGRTG